MLNDLPQPICAFLVSIEGTCRPIQLSDKLQGEKSAGGYTWLHFDVGDLALEKWLNLHLPMTVANELMQPETRPRCDRVENGLVLNLRGVNTNPGADADDMVSIRLWITDELIISARKRKILAVDEIRQQMNSGAAPATIGLFVADLAYRLSKRIEKVSLSLVEDTDALEENTLTPSKDGASELASLRQSVIKLRRFVRPQSQALDELSDGQVWPLDTRSTNLLRETTNRTVRTLEELDATADRLQAIQDYLETLHTSALGRNSYVLSIVAAIFLPLGFLTGLFGINVGGMPGVDHAYGFWIVTGGSMLVGIVLLFVFRYLKWL